MNKKKTKPKKRSSSSIGKIQQIDWLDHSSHSGWVVPAHLQPKVIATSFGQVIYEDKDWVQLAGTRCDVDNNVGMVMNIIKRCILKRRTLR